MTTTIMRFAAPARPVDARVVDIERTDAGLGQFAHDAVDQEGLVVLDDGQDVIAGGRTISGGQGLDDDARGLAGLAHIGGGPDPGQKGGQIGSRKFGGLVVGIVFVSLRQIGADQRPPASSRLRERLFQRLQGNRLRDGAKVAGHGQGLVWRGTNRKGLTTD
jgi:hypothetical protein